MIQMKLYYASVFEYIMIWGTPDRLRGPLGPARGGLLDTVLDGEMWYYGEGQFEKRVYGPGDRVYVGPNQARAMNFTTGVWAVEYARGPLPLSIPFGVADELVSTLDFATAAQTLGVYASLVGHHWRQPHPRWRGAVPAASHPGLRARPVAPVVTRIVRPPEPDDTVPHGLSLEPFGGGGKRAVG